MPDLLPPSVAIAIVTVATPKPPSEGYGQYRHLIGVALFEVEERAPGDYRYRLQLRTIPAGISEALLVNWLTSRLPPNRIMIGWRLADRIVPALLDASDSAAPDDAGVFIDALAAAIAIDAVDLADEKGGVAAPSFASACAAANVPAQSMTESAIFACWGIGREIELIGMLAMNVVAAWRLWAIAQRPADEVPHRFAADVLAHWRIDDETAHVWQDEGGDDDASL